MPVCYGPNLKRLKDAMKARCEDGDHPVFESQEVALLWMEGGDVMPRHCPRCMIRRDVLGIPDGPLPSDEELRRLQSEPREMGA